MLLEELPPGDPGRHGDGGVDAKSADGARGPVPAAGHRRGRRAQPRRRRLPAVPERALGPAPDALAQPEREPGLLLSRRLVLLEQVRPRARLGRRRQRGSHVVGHAAERRAARQALVVADAPREARRWRAAAHPRRPAGLGVVGRRRHRPGRGRRRISCRWHLSVSRHGYSWPGLLAERFDGGAVGGVGLVAAVDGRPPPRVPARLQVRQDRVCRHRRRLQQLPTRHDNK
jgi:hypothetical protein